MDHAAQVASHALAQSNEPNATPNETLHVAPNSSRVERLPATIINVLWTRMTAIYGHRWVSSYSDDPGGLAGDTWAAGLAGLNGGQLATGLKACTQSPDGWPPTMPEFRMMCFAIPAFGEVLQDLRPGAPNVSPFARYLWGLLDPYALRHADARTERNMIREAYDVACRHVLAGGELPAEAIAIAHDPEAERLQNQRCHDAWLKRVFGDGTQ